MNEKQNNFLNIPGANNNQRRSSIRSSSVIKGGHAGKVYYEGEWMDGKPHGKGKVYLPDGSYF